MLASVESESVVTTFYNMAGMKSIFFRAICFFAFEASPPPQKSISMIHFVPLFFGGVALHMITCPPPSRREAGNGAPLSIKIATRPFRSELLSFPLHSVEALYYVLNIFRRLWSAQNRPVAEANRKEYEDVYTKR